MILAVDVHYVEDTAYIAGTAFEHWDDETPFADFITVLEHIEAYASGQFYKRELPCILKLLDEHHLTPDVIVIDGYVYLDADQRPGLGHFLYNALFEQTAVIGVAKRPFQGIGEQHEILRGASLNPLFVTTTGELESAKQNIASMFGEYRIPTLLKRVDRLCRESADAT